MDAGTLWGVVWVAYVVGWLCGAVTARALR